jgi:cytochrome c oxidase subunit I+III
MHITGLVGMPRRVYTYLPDMPWATLNLVSTIGAYMIAAGVAVFLVDVALNFRPAQEQAGNVWDAGTLEWLENGRYQTRSIPIVTSREPLWDQPGLNEDVKAGRYYLPGAPTGGRETLVTSPIEARPQYVAQIPGPSWAHVLAALFTAAFFLGLTVKLYTTSIICGVLAVACVLVWMWDTDHGPVRPPVDIGGGLRLPVYVTGPESHSWWGMIVLMIVTGTAFACLVFSYLFLWTISPGAWPPPPVPLAPLWIGLLSAGLYAASSVAMLVASRVLARPDANPWVLRGLIGIAIVLLISAIGVELVGQRGGGVDPTQSGYGATIFALASFQGFLAAVLAIMGLFTIARSVAGKLDAVRRVTFDNTAVYWHAIVVQGLIALAVVHGFPRLLG